MDKNNPNPNKRKQLALGSFFNLHQRRILMVLLLKESSPRFQVKRVMKKQVFLANQRTA